jgi:hypothetical protein
VTGEVVYVTQNWLAIELNRGSCNSRRQLSAWQSRGTGAGLVLVVEVESVVELGEVVGIIVTVISSVVEVSTSMVVVKSTVCVCVVVALVTSLVRVLVP